jgi:hypothetical protein
VHRGQLKLFAALKAMKTVKEFELSRVSRIVVLHSSDRSSTMWSDAPQVAFLRWAANRLALALTAIFTLSGLAPTANAQVSGYAQGSTRTTVASLEGSWSGGGTVSFAGGTEQARCRARFSRAGGKSYAVNATCATASGKAAQTATVRQVGTNRYSGRFYNSEYSISGVIDIIVRGSNQIVRLTSDNASAVLNLSR